MWRPVRLLSFGFGACALVALAMSCARGSAPPARSVLSLGDSLAVGTNAYLAAALPDWTVTTAAVAGRRTAEGLEVLRRRQGKLPDVVLVSLGTNDDPANVASFAAAVGQVERIAGADRCVVWATIVRPPVNGVAYDGLNGVLRAEASRHRNFLLVDWERMVEQTPGLLAADGVHAIPAGYEARAAESASGIRRC